MTNRARGGGSTKLEAAPVKPRSNELQPPFTLPEIATPRRRSASLSPGGVNLWRSAGSHRWVRARTDPRKGSEIV